MSTPRPLAASLARKSTHDPVGIRDQHDLCAQRATAEGLELPDSPEFRFSEDDTSGVAADRKGLERLLAIARSGAAPFSVLYVKDSTRLGRWDDPRTHFFYEVELKRLGIEVRYLDAEPGTDFSGERSGAAIGHFLKRAVDVVWASEERKRLIRRVTLGLRARVKSGAFPGSTAPYGYDRWLVNGLTGEFVERIAPGAPVRREEHVYGLKIATDGSAEVVRRIFDAAEAGEPVHAIARALTTDGIAPPAARKRRNAGARWSGGAVHRILRNPIYCGDLVWGRGRASDDVKPVPVALADLERCNTPLLHAAFLQEPLIGRAQWEAVQQALSGVRALAIGRRRSEPVFVLSGLLKCARCGAALTGHTSTRGQPVRRRYYKHGRRTGFEQACQTHATYLPADAAEAIIQGWISTWLETPELAETLREALHDVLRGHRDDHWQRERAEIERAIEAKTRDAEEAAEMALSAESATERELYRGLAARRAKETDELRHGLQALTERNQRAQLAARRLDERRHAWLDPLTLYRDATFKEKKRILAGMLASIRVDLDGRTIDLEVLGP